MGKLARSSKSQAVSEPGANHSEGDLGFCLAKAEEGQDGSPEPWSDSSTGESTRPSYSLEI